MRTIVVIALAMIAFVPASAQGHAAPAQPDPSAHGLSPATGSSQNFSTPDASDIRSVVVSPDGNWVAAASSNKQVFLFSSSSSGGILTPSATLSLPADVTTMALSNTGGSGNNPVLILGVLGSLEEYDVPSSTPSWNYSSFATSGTAAVTSVAVSLDGTDIAAVVAQTPSPTNGAPHYTYAYYQHDVSKVWYNSSSYATASDVSMTLDGTRIAVGETLSAVASVKLFQSTGGSPQVWNPGAQYSSSSYNLASAQISGNGTGLYEVSSSGFDTTSAPGQPSAISSLGGASLLSVSYGGCQALVGSGSTVYYFDVPHPGQNACNTTSYTSANWRSPAWSASFPSTVTALSLAQDNPSYFVVATGNEVLWFYAYPGLSDTPQSAYRTLYTDDTVFSAATSSTGTVTGIGSEYKVGALSEFTLAQDSGAPVPAPLAVTVSQVSPDPGAPAASETVSWSAPPTFGFDEVSFTVTTASGGSVSPPAPVTNLHQTSTTLTGLSFSTPYTVTVTLVVYGGEASSDSQPVTFQTAGAPPVQDPFLYLEIAAVAVLAAGLVAYLVLQSQLPKPPSSPPGQAGSPGDSAPRVPPPKDMPSPVRGNP